MTTVNTEEMHTNNLKIKQKWLEIVTALLIVHDFTTLFITSLYCS